MGIESLSFQEIEFQKYAELTFVPHTFEADDTYEDTAEFDNTEDDWILFIRATGSNVTVRFAWDVEMEAQHTEDILVESGKIYRWGPQGTRFGSKITMQAKIATKTANSADFALLKVTWFKGTGIGA
jgi:hypothetical protein